MASPSRCWSPTWPIRPGSQRSRPGSPTPSAARPGGQQRGVRHLRHVRRPGHRHRAARAAVNVTAPVRLTRGRYGPCCPARRGAVLNVSSVAGLQATPGNATYGASKAFVASFGESVAGELVGTGVTLTTVLPGFTRTEFHHRAGVGKRKVPDAAWMSPRPSPSRRWRPPRRPAVAGPRHEEQDHDRRLRRPGAPQPDAPARRPWPRTLARRTYHHRRQRGPLGPGVDGRPVGEAVSSRYRALVGRWRPARRGPA